MKGKRTKSKSFFESSALVHLESLSFSFFFLCWPPPLQLIHLIVMHNRSPSPCRRLSWNKLMGCCAAVVDLQTRWQPPCIPVEQQCNDIFSAAQERDIEATDRSTGCRLNSFDLLFINKWLKRMVPGWFGVESDEEDQTRSALNFSPKRLNYLIQMKLIINHNVRNLYLIVHRNNSSTKMIINECAGNHDTTLSTSDPVFHVYWPSQFPLLSHVLTRLNKPIECLLSIHFVVPNQPLNTWRRGGQSIVSVFTFVC